MSKFGFQPMPLIPPDFDEFLQYQNNLNDLIRGELHETKQNKAEQIEKPKNKKSTNNNKNGKLGNRNRGK
tara:strand:- start:346 stop:555 length:210 start_codon:yes stop_codon:yes gene_type:complete